MTFINWLITSSADPQKTSLAFKGTLTLLAGYGLHATTLACGLGLLCLGVDQVWLDKLVELLTNIIFGLTTVIGSAITLWGIIRKFYYARWSAPIN